MAHGGVLSRLWSYKVSMCRAHMNRMMLYSSDQVILYYSCPNSCRIQGEVHKGCRAKSLVQGPTYSGCADIRTVSMAAQRELFDSVTGQGWDLPWGSPPGPLNRARAPGAFVASKRASLRFGPHYLTRYMKYHQTCFCC